ncbi:beta-phosphoglucomutase [Pseudoalteromonas denitrificans]|jgi:beta-phosphoglucomutase|uniref:Beta-phosphoglucomutase n=1 Tax=Pseudoalteromonas denitrificans DSM 6059 TaxID=1123010 RepID=A0A1I1LZT0_9GAMM|nr:beta-phosphoglucomutase [Pseudoalteromonas denitrificans]SFC78002.1 beta-phosphoglucomutase [Pseudoalteromonas denitrificans DSM 6059]
MINTHNQRGIIFDLDGVLTDTAHLHFVAWQTLAKKLNIEFTIKNNEELKGIDRMNSLQYILNLSDIKMNLEDKHKLCEEKNSHYLELIKTISSKDLFNGSTALLTDIKAQGIKIGLASASKNARLVIKNLGISDVFDYIADAHNIKNSKPDPEIFLKAAEGLGCDPKNCIGIEDAKAGVSAIKSANMKAIGIGCSNELSQADMVYKHLKNLKLESILAL